MQRLLGDRRASRQGGRLRGAGRRGRAYRVTQWQLFRREGFAVVRNGGVVTRRRYSLLEALRLSIEILVNVAPRETRAAGVENGVVQEIYVERTSRRGLVSNLYKGRVSRVLPGMQAAFVDIGLDRTAFLHAADIAGTPHDETVVGLSAGNGSQHVEDIRRLVNQGDDILVQVIKDPIGTKGARLTTFVALPSRYQVYMPRGDGIG